MFADVTSANIVGYMNKVGNNEDKARSKMLGGSFVNIGTNSLHLTDLKITGYENVSNYKTSGTGNSFCLAKVASSGSFEHEYYWKDTFDSGSQTWAGGYWYDLKTDKIIVKDSEDDIEITRGSGFWCTLGRKRTGPGIFLISSGQVLVASQAVVANDTDKGQSKSLCNPMPVACRLSEVSFTGYENVSNYKTSGTGNSFMMAKVASGGTFDHEYYWKDTFNTGTQTWTGGYWYDLKTDKVIVPDSDDDILIEPGDGFWCSIGRKRTSPGINVVWPKVKGLAE